MKRTVLSLLLLTLALSVYAGGQQDSSARTASTGPWEPTKPIELVIYPAPGGQLDLTARKFIEIAGRYTNATFVPSSRTGAGGMIGLAYVLSQPTDGYTLMAVTKTLVANLVISGTIETTPVNSLDWIAYLINDPEVVVTRKGSPTEKFVDLMADAKARPGQQIWVAPPGVDEVMAYKVWDAAGVRAQYVPFTGGADSMAEVISGRAAAYVGNPVDVRGREDYLTIAAIAGDKRYSQFPDVPTFKELGILGLENESMWRGFAVKSGTPDNIIAWYHDLFAKVSADRDWIDHYERDGMQVVHQGREVFNKMIYAEVKEFEIYLGEN